MELKVGNRKLIWFARENPSDQSFRPGVPSIEDILYNWSISEVPGIKKLNNYLENRLKNICL